VAARAGRAMAKVTTTRWPAHLCMGAWINNRASLCEKEEPTARKGPLSPVCNQRIPLHPTAAIAFSDLHLHRKRAYLQASSNSWWTPPAILCLFRQVSRYDGISTYPTSPPLRREMATSRLHSARGSLDIGMEWTVSSIRPWASFHLRPLHIANGKRCVGWWMRWIKQMQGYHWMRGCVYVIEGLCDSDVQIGQKKKYTSICPIASNSDGEWSD